MIKRHSIEFTQYYLFLTLWFFTFKLYSYLLLCYF
jgi:hypothetical protein